MQKSVSPKRGVGTKEKDDRPRLRNASSHDYQKTVFVESKKKQTKKALAQHLLGQCVLS